jgi:hypothetical protein
MRSRVVSVVLVLGLLVGGSGTLAASGGLKGASSSGSAAITQYRPGKGCGDRNHQHARAGECRSSASKKKSAR